MRGGPPPISRGGAPPPPLRGLQKLFLNGSLLGHQRHGHLDRKSAGAARAGLGNRDQATGRVSGNSNVPEEAPLRRLSQPPGVRPIRRCKYPAQRRRRQLAREPVFWSSDSLVDE
jgi:hypothetical protein